MNFKNNQVLLLLVAFLVGFFFHKILKGCHIVEGQENPTTASDDKYAVAVSVASTGINPVTTTKDVTFLKKTDFKNGPPTADAIVGLCMGANSYPKIRQGGGLCHNEMFNVDIARHTCIDENMTHFKNNNTICSTVAADNNPDYDYDLDKPHCNTVWPKPSEITDKRDTCCHRVVEDNMEIWGQPIQTWDPDGNLVSEADTEVCQSFYRTCRNGFDGQKSCE